MLKKRITLSITLALAFLMATASSINGQQASSEMLTEEFHQTYPLAATGRVSLGNINGSVRVAAWDRNEVKVDAVKKAYRRDRLDEAKIEVRSDAEGIHIETQYPTRSQTFTDGEGRYNNPAIVEYTLTVPRTARIDSIELINGDLDMEALAGDIKASSINGRVSARNLTGVVKLSTINGKLEGAFNQLDAAKPITLSSINGQVTLIIPSDANAEVKASTVHGQITNEFGLPVRRGKYVGRDLAGQIGQGGARIRLGNVNGQISIRHAADGRPLNRATSLLGVVQEDGEDGDEANLHARRVAREAAREAARAKTEVRRAQLEARRTELEARRAELEAQRVQRELERQEQIKRAQVDTSRAATEARQAIAGARARAQINARAAREAERAIQQERARIRTEVERVARETARIDRAEVITTNNLRLIERETKNFNVSGTPNLNLQTFDGAITVRGWDRPQVQLTVSKRAATEQQMRGIRVDTQQNGSAVSIVARFDQNFARREGSVTFNDAMVNLDLYVPRNSTLRLSSGDGRLELEGVSGQMDLSTGDGRIEVREARGQLIAKTGDGPITVANFNGQVEVRTGDGRIMLDGRFEGLTARTEEGSILLSVPADYNAVVETNAASVQSEGLSVTEETNPSRRLKRWKIGSGGRVLTLRTETGRIILRRAAGH